MQCASCQTEISSAFKHAISQNICPACGGPILDEEMLALIEHMENTISSEIMLKEETIKKLVMLLLSQYHITLQEGFVAKPIHTNKTSEESVKIAKPSAMQQASKPNIITAEEVNEGISAIERQKIMENAVRERYNMVDQVQSSELIEENDIVEIDNSELFSEGGAVPILEQERIARLAKQKKALVGGGGSFRRSG